MLRYGRHARDQMRRRGVTEADVEAALTSEFSRMLTGKPSLRIMGFGQPGRVLKIWGPLDDDTWIRSVAWRGEADEGGRP